MGMGDGHAFPMGQTNRLAFRRHAQSTGHFLAQRIKDRGGIRTQFHHVIDIVPTILEATGIDSLLRSMASRKSRSKASA